MLLIFCCVIGASSIVASIGDNGKTGLRRIVLRDNYISANAGGSLKTKFAVGVNYSPSLAGELLVDALYRNQTLTVADFRGNEHRIYSCYSALTPYAVIRQPDRSRASQQDSWHLQAQSD